MTSPTQTDPWAGADKTPAVSFKDAAVGDTIALVVTEKARLVQSRDYNTGEPKFWPTKNPAETPNPVMSLVVSGTVDGGEVRSLWAQKPSAMFAALNEARKTSPTNDFEVGGTIEVRYTGDKPNQTNPRLNPAKQYAARYTPPAAGSGDTGTEPVGGRRQRLTATPTARRARPLSPRRGQRPLRTSRPEGPHLQGG